ADLRRVLHAFGEHGHAELMAERDDRATDPSRAGVGADVVHEALVDLERVDREPAEVIQARIAGPEIVERKFYAKRLERAHRAGHALDVAGHHALGQLQADVTGW